MTDNKQTNKDWIKDAKGHEDQNDIDERTGETFLFPKIL